MYVYVLCQNIVMVCVLSPSLDAHTAAKTVGQDLQNTKAR